MFQQCVDCLKDQRDDLSECWWAWKQCLCPQCFDDRRLQRPSVVKKRDDVDLDKVDRLPLFQAPVILSGIELSREAVQSGQGIAISALSKRKFGTSNSSGVTSRTGALPPALQQAENAEMQQPMGLVAAGTPQRLAGHGHHQHGHTPLTYVPQQSDVLQQQPYADDGGQLTLMSTMQHQQKQMQQPNQQLPDQQQAAASHLFSPLQQQVQQQQASAVAMSMANQQQQAQQSSHLYAAYGTCPARPPAANTLQSTQQMAQNAQGQWQRVSFEAPNQRPQQTQVQQAHNVGQQMFAVVRESTPGLVRQECTLPSFAETETVLPSVQQVVTPAHTTAGQHQQQQALQQQYQQQQMQLVMHEPHQLANSQQLLLVQNPANGVQQVKLQPQPQVQRQLGNHLQQLLQDQLILQQPQQQPVLVQPSPQQQQQQPPLHMQLPLQQATTPQQLLQQIVGGQQAEGTGSGGYQAGSSRQGTPAPAQGLGSLHDLALTAGSGSGDNLHRAQLQELNMMQLATPVQSWPQSVQAMAPSSPLQPTTSLTMLNQQQECPAWDGQNGMLQQQLQQQQQLPVFDGLSLHGAVVSQGLIIASNVLQQPAGVQAVANPPTPIPQQQLAVTPQVQPQQLPAGGRGSVAGIVQEQQAAVGMLPQAAQQVQVVQQAQLLQQHQQHQVLQQQAMHQQAAFQQQQQHAQALQQQALQQQQAAAQQQQAMHQQRMAMHQQQQQQQHHVIQQQAATQQQQALMLPPPPRQPGQQQQQQQQNQQHPNPQQQGTLPPWRQELGTAAAISAVAGDKEIPWEHLQFGHQIGEGGFGKVYYGTCHGVAVAIKVLNAQAADSAKLMGEFLREVTTMTRLPEHPNVLKLLGVCTKPPNLALVTQFCAKGSLYGLLHSPGCYLSWVEVVAMLLDAARGMEHLHAHSVLHRDLKSGNLLVDHEGCVKVADFGLSRLYHGMHTMTGGLGTFQWMAPEVLANQRYSNKADIYSFGMVMWECCAREVPFEGLNGVQAALAVMAKGMRPQIPPHTPPGLATLIQECWAAVPEQRPGFDVITIRLQELLNTLKQQEINAVAAAAANATAAKFNAQSALFAAGIGAG